MSERNGGAGALGPRVLVVAPLYHPDRGGLGRQAVLLTEKLAALGARPRVLTRAMRGLPARRFSPRVQLLPVPAGREDVHNYEAPDLSNLLTSLRFSLGSLATMVLLRGSYDLVHVHGASLPLLLLLPAAKLLGKPVVAKVAALHQGVEAGDLRGHWGPLGPALAWLAGRADAFVATTAEIGEALAGEGYPPERVARIPNFVDLSRFRPPEAAARAAARAALGFEERTVVLSSGRLTARKGSHTLLEAFARAARATPAARPLLCFLGDGPEREALAARAAALGLLADDPARAGVAFLGFHEDVERYLGAADVFVLASTVEGLPNALLEALAVGLPAVATRIGGCLEVAQDGETALLVRPDDVEDLAGALSRLLGDPALRARLGAAAARDVAARFTLEAVAPRYLELYRRLLSGAPAAGV